MTIEDIQKIISTDETRTLELKKSTGELKDGMHSACAFLNTDGGWLIFGIAPTTLKIIGQQVTDKTRQDIAQAIKGLEPMIDIPVEYIEVPERHGNVVIAMHFDGWKRGKEPFSYHGCPYIRVESTTQVMPKEVLYERIKMSRPSEFAWENQIADGLSISDLDSERIIGSVRSGVRGGRLPETALSQTTYEILDSFGLLVDGKPNNAAVMLFIKNPQGFPQLKIRMASFVGTEQLEFIDNKIAEGNFFDLLDASMAFCFKHLNLSGKVVGLKREESLDIPYEALREGLVNAFCHRRYDQPGTSIGLAIYSDRLEIENPGQLPIELDAETIKIHHKSHPFNHKIANVLFKANYIEGWGTGVARMVKVCQEANIPEPNYNVSNGFITLRFIRSNSDMQNVRIVSEIQLSDRQKIILDNLRSNPGISTKRMSEMLAVNIRTINRDLSMLQDSGFVRKEGSTRNTRWVIVRTE